MLLVSARRNLCTAVRTPGTGVFSVQVNSVDLLWNSILSSMTSGNSDGEDPGDGGGEKQEQELASGVVDGTAVRSSAPVAAAAAAAKGQQQAQA